MKKAWEIKDRNIKVREMKKLKKSTLTLLFLSLLISLFTLVIFAKAQNYYYYTPSQIYYGDYEKFFPGQTATSIACNKTTNFLVYLDPIEGCQPPVVRSDLLEEQPVPVFCKLKAINLNPLLQNIYIKDVSISVENKSDLVGGVLFHMPWLGEKLLSGYLWSNYGYKQGIASFDNLGYAVVYLKPTPESKMPDKVDVNAKARIRYSAGYLFGIDRNTFLIPELSDEEWQARFNEFSFFNGKGFIRVKKIYQDRVDVEIYKESINDPTPIRLTLIKDRPVKVGFWGFFCNNQEFEVNLDSLELPRKKARVVINGNEYLLAEREEAEGCRVESIEEGVIRGSGKVTVDCGGKTTTLEVSPLTVEIEKNGKRHSLSLGDRIKVGEENKESQYAYLVCAKKTRNEKIAYFYLGDRKARYKVERLIRDNIQAKGGIDCSVFDDMKGVEKITNEGKIKDTNIKITDIFEYYDRILNREVEQAFEEAKEKYDSIFFKYKDERDESGEYIGARALFELADLAEKIGKRTEAINVLSKLIKEYEGTDSGLVIKAERKKRQLLQFDYSKARSTLESGGNLWSLELIDIEAPYSTDIYAELEVNGEKDIYWLQRPVGEGWIVEEITDSYVKFKNVKSGESYGKETTITVGKENCIEAEEECLLNIKVIATHVKKIAQISVKPPDIEYVAETNFSIHIGIEKRAIKIAPEKALEAARKLNETIKKIDKFNEKLGKLTQAWTKACYVGGTALFLKNFLTGMSGEALARKIAMRGTSSRDGWTAICTEKVTKGEFKSLSQCFRENEEKIEEDVGKIKDFIRDVNTAIKNAENECKEKKGEEQVRCIYEAVYKNSNLPEQIEVKEEQQTISLKDFFNKTLPELSQRGYFYKDQLKDVFLNLKISQCTRCSEELKNLTKKKTNQFIISNFERAKEIENLRPEEEIFVRNEIPLSEKRITLKTPLLKIKDKEKIGLKDEEGNYYYFLSKVGNLGWFYFVVKKEMGKYQIINAYEYDVKNRKINKTKTLESILGKNGLPSWEKLREKIDIVEAECNAITINYRYASFFDKAPQSDRIGYMPVIAEQGWYVFVPNKPESYLGSGAINSYYICNVGKDGIPDLASYGQADDDQCIYVTPENKHGIQNIKLCEGQQISLANIISKAERCVSQANVKKREGLAIETDCGTFKVKKQVSLPTAQCEDFMSPSDCWKLFNLCDPVLCPPSRCDLGGRYPVDNVVQTGIIGSLVLCLPNFEGGKGVLMPVCLTGLHSGINFLSSMLKDTSKCLEVSAKTGKNIGICDQIKSIYLCDMLWRELTPFLKIGIPSLISKVERKGGGEYATFSSTWQQTMQGLSYFYQVYGKTSSEAFKIRSTAEAGSMICKKFLGVRYPNAASLLEEISKPAGPYQFFAKVDEFPFTQVTYPPQSHYKVFFQIYAGTDTDVYYAVYLRNPPQYAAINVPQQLVIDTGFIARGQSISKSPDLTAVSGYKEICININGREECGFDVVSTSYAVNWLQDKYVEDQLKANIKTRQQCVSGESSLMPTASLLNLQAGIEKALSPAIYKQGIIRVCSSFNPGKGVSEEQWRAVGYCDDPNINCWVYLPSVKKSIKDLGLENQTIEWLEEKSKEIMPELAKQYLSPDQEQEVATEMGKFLDDKINNYKELINNIESKISEGEIKEEKNEIKNNIEQIEKDISEAEENITKILNPFLLKKLEQKLATLYKQRTLLKFYYHHLDELIQEAKEKKEKEKVEEKPTPTPEEEVKKEEVIDTLPVDNENLIKECDIYPNGKIVLLLNKESEIKSITYGKIEDMKKDGKILLWRINGWIITSFKGQSFNSIKYDNLYDMNKSLNKGDGIKKGTVIGKSKEIMIQVGYTKENKFEFVRGEEKTTEIFKNLFAWEIKKVLAKKGCKELNPDLLKIPSILEKISKTNDINSLMGVKKEINDEINDEKIKNELINLTEIKIIILEWNKFKNEIKSSYNENEEKLIEEHYNKVLEFLSKVDKINKDFEIEEIKEYYGQKLAYDFYNTKVEIENRKNMLERFIKSLRIEKPKTEEKPKELEIYLVSQVDPLLSTYTNTPKIIKNIPIEICMLIKDKNGNYYFPKIPTQTTVKINGKSIKYEDIEKLNIKNADIKWYLVVPYKKHQIGKGANVEGYSNGYIWYRNTEFVSSPYLSRDKDTMEHIHGLYKKGKDLWCVEAYNNKPGTYWYRTELNYSGKIYYSPGRPANKTEIQNSNYGKIYKENAEEVAKEQLLINPEDYDFLLGGISNKVLRVSVIGWDKEIKPSKGLGFGYVRFLYTYANIPWIYGATPYQSTNYIGFDCAELAFASYYNYINYSGLGKIELKDYSATSLAFDNKITYDVAEGTLGNLLNNLKFGNCDNLDVLCPGDIILISDSCGECNDDPTQCGNYYHTIILKGDANGNDILDGKDEIIEACHDGFCEKTLNEKDREHNIYTKYVKIKRFKKIKDLSATT